MSDIPDFTGPGFASPIDRSQGGPRAFEAKSGRVGTVDLRALTQNVIAARAAGAAQESNGQPAPAETSATPRRNAAPPAAPPRRNAASPAAGVHDEADDSPPSATAQGPDAPASTTPAQEREESEQPPQAVPYERLQMQVRERKRLEKELKERQEREAALLEELQSFRRQRVLDEVEQAEKPEGFEDWSPGRQAAWFTEEVNERLGKFGAKGGRFLSPEATQNAQRTLLENVLMREHRVPPDAVEDVADLIERSSGELQPNEAVEIVRYRKPELFQQEGATQEPEGGHAAHALPASHVVNPPRAGQRQRRERKDPVSEAYEEYRQVHRSGSGHAQVHALGRFFAETFRARRTQ